MLRTMSQSPGLPGSSQSNTSPTCRSASPGVPCPPRTPPILLGTCPICLDTITSHDDVFTLGCRGRRGHRNAAPHQIHCTPCGHEWLRQSVFADSHLDGIGLGNVPTATRPVQCPICRDERTGLNSMRPGGTYAPSGCVMVLTWSPSSQLPLPENEM